VVDHSAIVTNDWFGSAKWAAGTNLFMNIYFRPALDFFDFVLIFIPNPFSFYIIADNLL